MYCVITGFYDLLRNLSIMEFFFFNSKTFLDAFYSPFKDMGYRFLFDSKDKRTFVYAVLNLKTI